MLRSVHTAISSPAGARGTFDLKVVDRRFGPIPEEEFDPDRFLDGPQVTDIGGTITFLSRSKDGANLINSHDLGRQVQQSYYSGSHPFGRRIRAGRAGRGTRSARAMSTTTPAE